MSGLEPAVLRTPAEMTAWSEGARARGERIAFVPTMGALHEGHVSLLREGRRRGDKLALSIFVNPTQFAPTEDLARYPRDLPGDLAKASSADTDVAYCPEPADVYPPGFQTYVQVREVELGLDGGSRPGHFVGVATVVCKLFNVVRPHVALFGEKDFQQLAVVRRMVSDLDMGVEIVGMPIVREPDGLAMSSRNAYLSPDERQRALALSRGLNAARLARRARANATPRPSSGRHAPLSRVRSTASTTSSSATPRPSRPRRASSGRRASSSPRSSGRRASSTTCASGRVSARPASSGVEREDVVTASSASRNSLDLGATARASTGHGVLGASRGRPT